MKQDKQLKVAQENFALEEGGISNWLYRLGIVGIIWLLGGISDRLWLAFDRSVPGWDQADYLNGALNYWNALQQPEWFNPDWWRSFWLLSNKIPPLHYILTAPFFNLFGITADAAMLVMILYSGILLTSVYGLGVILFNPTVGLWAAGICQILPGLYYYRLEFLLDYPLTAIVIASFWLLTVWNVHHRLVFCRDGSITSPTGVNRHNFQGWVYSLLFGVSLGLALMLKQTALFFLFLPILWVLASSIRHRQWLCLTQLISSLAIAILICFPWYRTNWLLILTSGKRATIDSAIAEGDPALNTLGAWTYYSSVLPYLLSWCLLLVPLVGLILFALFKNKKNGSISPSPHHPISIRFKWTWLSVFLLGGYLLSSLNINKDARYILPLLPVLSLILAKGLLSWNSYRQKYVRWGTIILAVVLMWLNIFPLGGDFLTAKLSPRVQHYPYTGKPFPHREVVQEIINTSPYLRSTLGVLPSTPEINQHNFSFYGGQYNFQVAGRQVGVRKEEVEQDARSLDWFITKTGDQGSIPEAQKEIVQLVEEGGDFNLHKSWQLPDNSDLTLYHRLEPKVEVKAIKENLPTVSLKNINIPSVAPPGVPIPVTYEWTGSGEKLRSSLVLLTWQKVNKKAKLTPKSQITTTSSIWLHDHSIGMGVLDFSKNKIPNTGLEVIERTAMLPPPNTLPGKYRLSAQYLDRTSGEIYPVDIPNIEITIDPDAKPLPAPELDLVTQLRTIAPNMAQGIRGLEPIFAQTARINQYDAKQDYLFQAELALSYRLQQNNLKRQQKLDWTYTLGLAQVLQQDVEGAIATFQKVIQLDSQNPFSYAYLAFVYLYDWKPQLAEKALNSAIALNPDSEEIQTLSGIAALMQGNLIKAWQLLVPLLD